MVGAPVLLKKNPTAGVDYQTFKRPFFKGHHFVHIFLRSTQFLHLNTEAKHAMVVSRKQVRKNEISFS